MRVLILGGYGLIGQSVVRELLARGHDVTGLVRSPQRGRMLVPEASWRAGDLSALVHPEDWLAVLDGFDAVVNAAGALQSGLRDNLALVQRNAIVALVSACGEAGVSIFVQISAPGASPEAGTEFLSTKGEADEALRRSGLHWVILKPGLVISPTAYGGTNLLRMLAAFPIVQPIVLAGAKLQVVDVRDVAEAVGLAISEPRLMRREFDLVAPQAESLQQIVLAFRSWLGFPPPVQVWRLPRWVGRSVSGLADVAGLLGWRAPLRTTALDVLADDVTGDPEPWRRATGRVLLPLKSILRRMPASRQERVFARVQLLFPFLVVAMALFWLVSGFTGLWQLERGTALLAGTFGELPARLLVVAGSIIDIAVGAGVLLRRTFFAACLSALGVSIAYLVAGSFTAPELWADPLGPLLKIVPVMALALALVAMDEER